MEKPHVLVVDDDDAILSIMQEWLKRNGYQVTTAFQIDDVNWLSTWQWEKFDCIITGINQPGLTGIDLARLGGPPVIVLTGYDSERVKSKAIDAGAAAFFKKPSHLNDLLEVLDTICEKRIP